MQVIHIAIVGLGPRGLTVLERVREHAHRFPADIRVRILAFDCGEAGQGAHRAYQPDHLMINTLASQVTIFAPASVAGERDLSLVEWAHEAGYRRLGDRFVRDARGNDTVPITEADYLPRSLLGEYLSWAYGQVVSHLPSNIEVTHLRARVTDLVERDGGFDVVADGLDPRHVDYVFLTTGHGNRQPTDEDTAMAAFVEGCADRNENLAYFASPYPIERLATIAASSTVAVQGLGLSAHDVISSLTLGRGGRYVERDEGLRYVPSGDEPLIRLFSRNCLPFAARGINEKGLAGSHRAQFFTPEAIEEKRRAVLAATGQFQLDFERDVLPLTLKEMAYAYRMALHKREVDPAGFEATPEELAAIEAILWPLKDRRFESFEAFRHFFDTLFRDDLNEAFKGNLSSPVKAATDVLRDTRKAIRTAVEFGGLTPASHRYFVENFNATTNRVSFGPPKRRNVEYLALREAGLIDIVGGPGTRVGADEAHARFCIEADYPTGTAHWYADVLVVARLDTYSPLTDASPLSANLLARGLIRPYRNGAYHPGGLDIDTDLHPVGADGQIRSNLWAIGFPVEGPHFYTHALPRPQIDSRQTQDAEHCVLDLVRAIAGRRTSGAGYARELPARTVAPDPADAGVPQF
ncbi:FAD/NAD(P)-binding protein [Trinickia sp. NRRL B-1857]|uniref:FAD/NAD(P)-binding protein n=1 Tax=Trinickia sp. NRRL B-1857 TaxID=3162879 RepID=UPI003D296CF1